MTTNRQPRDTRPPASFLFTMRIWQERWGENQGEWRGQVEHLLSGKTCYFRDWSTLVSFLEETPATLEQDGISTEIAPGADQE